MSELSTVPQEPGEDEPGAHHDHVRTDGEISVDDALGGADDPQG
ncbi:hypothetical protein SAMN05192558_101194 [Actinokineospora alba]|uniref:Uncharacterized protein n=1 Tax=Actinokineospora alba TaxID=504798 RepID=A0A1H0F1U6_9PSEU|nr:hypothetical protein [Actinokineospora alba]TDP69304.1 hypothetical protein C8E96_4890 [Actinokineospora alba]SDI19722.1 hypothetical protein SAMN05421871_103676 [Actinokineospora alba]SDN88509.1 hypothetical protein SAMN05192558_101194 [Actinokineospora alba]